MGALLQFRSTPRRPWGVTLPMSADAVDQALGVGEHRQSYTPGPRQNQQSSPRSGPRPRPPDQRQLADRDALLSGLEQGQRAEQEVPLDVVEAGLFRAVPREVERLGVPGPEPLRLLEQAQGDRVPVQAAPRDSRVACQNGSHLKAGRARIPARPCWKLVVDPHRENVAAVEGNCRGVVAPDVKGEEVLQGRPRHGQTLVIAEERAARAWRGIELER